MTKHHVRPYSDTVVTPTSWAQERSWSRLRSGVPVPYRTLSLEGHGPLDPDALARAWDALVLRHHSLRTTLVELGGKPAQLVEALGTHDHRLWDADRPGPDAGPIALRLLGGERDHHVLELKLRDTVADDRSVSVLLRELGLAYNAAVEGRSALQGAFTAPAPQYTQHALLQRQGESTEEHQRLRKWWSTPRPLPGTGALPTDRGLPPVPSFTLGSLSFDWGRLPKATALARCEGVSPAATILTALSVLLSRYSGLEEVIVHIPVEGHLSCGYEEMVGRVDDVLPVHVMMTAERSFRTLLRQVDEAWRQTRLHDALPSQQLPEAALGSLDTTVFVLGQGPEHLLELANTTLKAREVANTPPPEVAARADLALALDGTNPFQGKLFHRLDRFDRGSAERVLDQIHHLVASALTAPDSPSSSLAIEPPERARARLRATDRSGDIPADPPPVHEIVRRHARKTPDAPAVSLPGVDLTYGELAQRAAAVSAALTADGPVAETPIVVRAPAGPEQVAAVLGVLDAGAHVVCLTQHDLGRHGVQLMEELRPTRLLLGTDDEDDAGTRLLRSEPGVRVVNLERLPTSRTGPTPSTRPGTMARPEDIACVSYTSGSSGRPKGIPQTHAALSQFSGWLAREFRMVRGSRVAQWALPGYDAALCETFAALCSGATLCPVPEDFRSHPDRVADWLVKERITLFQTVPSFARALLGSLSQRGPTSRPTRLECLLLAGEPLDGDLATSLREALPGTRIVNLYGATETILSTYHEVTGEVHGPVPLGLPLPGRQVAVLDDQDRPCPDGVVGRVIVRSPYVTPGYLGADEPAAFRPAPSLARNDRPEDRYHRTGDLARRRWDGTLEYRGRADDQVKVGGVRFEPEDLEGALSALPSVAECAVVPVGDTNGSSPRLVAYVIPHSSSEGVSRKEKRAWRSALRLRFGHRTPPVAFEVLAAMPRNLGGKVDRRDLADRARAATRNKDESTRWKT